MLWKPLPLIAQPILQFLPEFQCTCHYAPDPAPWANLAHLPLNEPQAEFWFIGAKPLLLN
jgi:hypothetical protein